ncbi:MAG TPA: universal stress protein [Verrucomicrobiae bacterium]
MRILVGTDFSEQAVRAADAAAALANGWGESIVLAHAHNPASLGEISPEALGEIAEAAESSLKTEANRLRATGVTVLTDLMTGAPYACLIEKAKPEFIEMIVVSSYGRSTAGRWLLGSVSERTAEGAHVPTLVVKNSKPIEEWTAGERPLRVVIACDLTSASDAALRFVKRLQKIGPCELTAAYVDSPLEERARLGLRGDAYLTKNDPEVQRVNERDLRRKVESILGDAKCEIIVEPNLGRPDFAVAHLANLRQADLVITGTHQRHGLNRLRHASFSRGLLHTCRTNVLCVPIATSDSEKAVTPVSRILVSTDFSKLGNSAVSKAFGLSRAGGTVHLIHVLPPAESPEQLIGGQIRRRLPTKKELLKLKRQVEAKLAELVPADAVALGIESEIEIVEDNDPAKAIVQAAERFGADAICLATHGHTGLKGTVMGSVAQAVVKDSKRPVCLVKVDEES